MGRQTVCCVYYQEDNIQTNPRISAGESTGSVGALYLCKTKGIDTSIRASTVPKLVVEIDDDDDKGDSDRMCAGNIPLDKQKCDLIPGKYSLIRPGEVEEPRDIASNIADEAPVQAEGVVKATRPTAKSYFDVGQGRSSTKHSNGSASLPATVAPGTQDLVLEEIDMNDQHLMKRKRVASNATSRKVPREEEANITTVESSAVADVRLEGHKSVSFYAFVEQRQHKQKIVLAYLDPPVHEENLLANEHMSSEYFVLLTFAAVDLPFL